MPVSDAVSGNCFSASSYPDGRQLRAESVQELAESPADVLEHCPCSGKGDGSRDDAAVPGAASEMGLV